MSDSEARSDLVLELAEEFRDTRFRVGYDNPGLSAPSRLHAAEAAGGLESDHQIANVVAVAASDELAP